MYRMRSWSVRNARWLRLIYTGIESALLKANPLLKWIGYTRLEKPFLVVEKMIKKFLLDSRSCGQCIVGSTGMACPMNCPKTLRNGPCGGVSPDGKCEVVPAMNCVWVLAWEGNKRMCDSDYPIQLVQPPVDNRLLGCSSWLREVRLKARCADREGSAEHEI